VFQLFFKTEFTEKLAQKRETAVLAMQTLSFGLRLFHFLPAMPIAPIFQSFKTEIGNQEERDDDAG
jgi:hypothetical protein